MLEKLVELSAKNKFVVVLFAAFAVAWGIWAIARVPLDAIPDLSDVQVIVFTEWPARSPDLVEDQVTYPLVSSMLAAPRVKVVRGYSFFGLSFVNVIFEDGTDMYWAQPRPRVPQPGAREAARRRDARPRPGRHRRGMGFPIRARG